MSEESRHETVFPVYTRFMRNTSFRKPVGPVLTQKHMNNALEDQREACLSAVEGLDINISLYDFMRIQQAILNARGGD